MAEKKKKEWEPEKITKPQLLFVEGKDEVNFFAALLKAINKSESIQVIDVGGEENFAIKVPVYTRMFTDVKTLAIVRDADENAANTFQSVQDTLLRKCETARGESIAVPQKMGTFTGEKLRVGVFIMPDNQRGGALEDLSFEMIKEEDAAKMKCVDTFIQCLSVDEKRFGHRVGKMKVQSFLAAKYEGKHLIRELGIAALDKYFDFENPCLTGLTTFLSEFN
ncbi:MAG: hypothetical protein IAF08_08810 [Rhizobacter sp.]|nr:hypothetical protein [Chlorobiales bacterium]